jgi:hypothetical protein
VVAFWIGVNVGVEIAVRAEWDHAQADGSVEREEAEEWR